MKPCDVQMQTEANTLLHGKDMLYRNALKTLTEPKCSECHVLRERDELILKLLGFQEAADRRLASLTTRQYEIMELVLAGHPSKNIAADLQISQRTVENHRAAIMKRTGSTSLPDLARTAVAAATKT